MPSFKEVNNDFFFSVLPSGNKEQNMRDSKVNEGWK